MAKLMVSKESEQRFKILPVPLLVQEYIYIHIKSINMLSVRNHSSQKTSGISTAFI